MHQGCPDDVQCSLGIKRYSKRGVLVHIKWIGGCAVRSQFSGVQVVLRHWPSHSIKWPPAGQCWLGQRGIRWPTNLKPTGAKRHTRSSTHVNLQHGQQRQRRIRLVMVCPSNLLPYVFTNPPKNSSLCLYELLPVHEIQKKTAMSCPVAAALLMRISHLFSLTRCNGFL